MAIKLFEELVEDINKKGWIVLSLKQINATTWVCHLQRMGKEMLFSPYAEGKTPSDALRAAMSNSASALKASDEIGGSQVLQAVEDRLNAKGIGKPIVTKSGLSLMQAAVLEKMVVALNAVIVSKVENYARTGSND